MTSHQVGKSRRRHAPRIGGPLRALLDERFVTQDELARAIGVQSGNVSRWVRNETGPYKRHIRAIAEFFDVPPASLIERPDDDEPVAA